MGVYVKGMKMPESCRSCEFEHHYENSFGGGYGFFCPLGYLMNYKSYTTETRKMKRLDDCPLIEVPEPHGRLFDLDNDENVLVISHEDGTTRIIAPVLIPESEVET